MSRSLAVLVLLQIGGQYLLAGCEAKVSPAASGAAAKVATVAPAPAVQYEATLAEGIQFEKPGYPRFIKSAAGMSGHEPTHRWTEGPTAVFTFADPLPRNFVLKFDLLGAFGPNVGKPLKVKVGDWQGEVIVGGWGKPRTAELQVKTSAPANVIQLTVAEPMSPQKLGMSSDPRMLGVAFKRLSIAPT